MSDEELDWTPLTSPPATLQPRDNWDFRFRATAVRTNDRNCNNLLQQFLHSNRYEPVTLQQPEEKQSNAILKGHQPQIEVNFNLDDNWVDIVEEITLALNPDFMSLKLISHDESVLDYTNKDMSEEPEPISSQSEAPPSYLEQPPQLCSPTEESNLDLAPDLGKSFDLGVQIHPANNESLSGSKSYTVLHPNPAPHAFPKLPSDQHTTEESNMDLAPDSGKSCIDLGVQIHPANNQSQSGSKSDTILHPKPAPLAFPELASEQHTAEESNMELATNLEHPFVGHVYQNPAVYQRVFSGNYRIPLRPQPGLFKKTTRKGYNNMSLMMADPVVAPEPILLQYPALTFSQQPTEQFTTDVKNDMDLTCDLENPVITQGFQFHPIDNQNLFSSKYTQPLRPTPRYLKKTLGKGYNMSLMVSDPVAVPEQILSQYPAPTSTEHCTTVVEVNVDLTTNLRNPVITQGCQIYITDNKSQTISSEYTLPLRSTPCNSMDTASKGSNMLSQILSNFTQAPYQIPPQCHCQHQEKQQYTSAANRKIQSAVHQEHPVLAQSDQISGPADKQSILLNPADQENLASESTKEFNGLSSTSSHNSTSSCDTNTAPNEKSNGNTTEKRFRRKSHREYTKEELEKMRKNNEASKRSREKRRLEEQKRERECEYLERRNQYLKNKLNTMMNEYNKGSAQVFRMFTIIAHRTRELNDLDTDYSTDNSNRQYNRFN